MCIQSISQLLKQKVMVTKLSSMSQKSIAFSHLETEGLHDSSTQVAATRQPAMSHNDQSMDSQ